MSRTAAAQDLHLLKVEIRAVEDVLETTFPGLRNEVNQKIVQLRGGGVMDSVKGWVATKSEDLWNAAKAWTKKAWANDMRRLEKAKKAAAAAVGAAKEAADYAVDEAKKATKDAAKWAAKYTWEKTTKGGRWLLDGASSKAKDAKIATKRQACNLSNRACGAEYVVKHKKRIKAWLQVVKRLKKKTEYLEKYVEKLTQQLKKQQKRKKKKKKKKKN